MSAIGDHFRDAHFSKGRKSGNGLEDHAMWQTGGSLESLDRHFPKSAPRKISSECFE